MIRLIGVLLFTAATMNAATITFTPAAPRRGESVSVRVEGVWPSTFCEPTRATARVVNRTILIEGQHPDNCAVCGAALSLYTLTASFQVPVDAFPGLYDVEFFTENCGGEVRLDTTQKIYIPANVCNFVDSLIAQPASVSIGQPVKLTWCDPGGATEYRVLTSESILGPFTEAATVAAGTTSYESTPVRVGPSYYFVEAHFAGDATLASNIVEVNPYARCAPSATTLCLGGGRFEVSATWQTGNDFRIRGSNGSARAVRQTDESGYFYFFDPANVELTVKVLNACAIGYPAQWIFVSGLTNLGVQLRVRDHLSLTRDYANPVGVMFRPIVDITTFRCR